MNRNVRWFLALILILTSISLVAQDRSVLSLERIFSSADFRSERFGPARWLGDGSGYTTLERCEKGTVAKSGNTKLPMSEKCSIEVKQLEGDKVEVSLFGKGEAVLKRTQALPKGELLVLGGNAPNETAWLVTLKRIE